MSCLGGPNLQSEGLQAPQELSLRGASDFNLLSFAEGEARHRLPAREPLLRGHGSCLRALRSYEQCSHD